MQQRKACPRLRRQAVKFWDAQPGKGRKRLRLCTISTRKRPRGSILSFTLPGCAQIERDGEIELGREPGIAREPCFEHEPGIAREPCFEHEPGIDSCRGGQICKPAA